MYDSGFRTIGQGIISWHVHPQKEHVYFVGSETMRELWGVQSCTSQSVILRYHSILSPPDLPDSSALQAELDSQPEEAPHSGALKPTDPFCLYFDSDVDFIWTCFHSHNTHFNLKTVAGWDWLLFRWKLKNCSPYENDCSFFGVLGIKGTQSPSSGQYVI